MYENESDCIGVHVEKAGLAISYHIISYHIII